MLFESTLAQAGLEVSGSNFTPSRVQTVPDEHSTRTMLCDTFPSVDQDRLNWILSDGEFKQINAPHTIDIQDISLPFSFAHKIICGLEDGEKADNAVHNQLFNEVCRVWKSTQSTLHDVNSDRTKNAFHEAIALTLSQLFSKEIYPDICIDPYGEFTFSHKSNAGYVDIGVRGERELSYHIRNDIDPSKTAFDDCKWNLGSLPIRLSEAMEALQNAIKTQEPA